MDPDLSRMYGIRYYSPTPTLASKQHGGSIETVSSVSSVNSLTHSPSPTTVTSGSFVVFSFIFPARCEKLTYKEQKQQLKSAMKDSLHFQDGLLLETKEKGVLFPVVHILESFKRQTQLNTILSENVLGPSFTLHQGIYHEVRNIIPQTELPRVDTNPPNQQNVGYILFGFKSLDKNFSQVMVDTWKDWTGARYVYMYLPDDLGLRKITFYHRQIPDDLSLFMYLVLVECHGITTREKQLRLLDFVQRMRLERMSGYISVYGGEIKNCSVTTPSQFGFQIFLKQLTNQHDHGDEDMSYEIIPQTTRI